MTHELLIDKEIRVSDNPKAKIGFILAYPIHFYFFKNIYKYIPEEVEFVVDLGVFYPVEQPPELLEAMIAVLKKHNASFRILYYRDYWYPSYLEKFFSKYEILVSLWPNGCINLKCNLLRRKASLMYGAGKNLNTFRPSQRKWDLYLSYGEHDFEILKLYTNAKIVGNPKFDDWFNNEFDASFLQGLRLRLNPAKKTILYLPTHSDLGSIKDLAKPLKKLSANYNIIVKFHHFNVTDEPELIKKLDHPNLILFKDDIDLLPLLKVTDVVLSDNSSAIFDAILADKPLVLADFIAKEHLEKEHRKIKYYRRGRVARAVTYTGSIEQKIKKEGLIVTLKKPEELKLAIRQGLEDKPFYRDARKKIRENLFSFNDGKCGQRAADALIDLLETEILPEKPILYHVFEEFEIETQKRSLSEQKRDAQLISKYKNLLSEKIINNIEQKIIFSVIVIHDSEKNDEFLRLTIRSLLGQTFPQQNYEIIVANGPSEQDIEKMIKEIPQINNWIPTINSISRNDNGSGLEFIEKAISMATGEIICFTKSGHLTPENWLVNFYLAYQKETEVAGIGGYIYQNFYTIFAEYYYLELGKKFGTDKIINYFNGLYEMKNSLFYQNPVGTLANMSYKKEFLEDLNINYQEISLIQLAEMMIKKKVLRKDSPLYFTPSRVISLEKITFKKFLQKNFEEGLSFYFFCIANPGFKNQKYYLYNIFSIIKLPLAHIFSSYHKKSLFFVIFIGTLFRWLGEKYGSLMVTIAKNQNRQ